ncbi:uncharacterized protein LOC116017567 isoform X2 [Ipomoea triloba]|uniref:uncharacterized protein LOC116017567 isoform X2 n=1 Tax=Ipomoea triloba TaxID=35885 RepID=UPI00125D7B6B|nr:uncharacterized protein LOC116017567 isoform X2 [Ipomoea triloba]
MFQIFNTKPIDIYALHLIFRKFETGRLNTAHWIMAKTFWFERTELRTFSDEEDQFRTPWRELLQEEEKCIIDNLWNMSSPQAKAKQVACIKALVSYFCLGKHKKPFTCYVLYTGPKAGVYLTWEELVPFKEELEISMRYGQPSYKGFYDIDEAIKSAFQICGKDIIISPDVKRYQEYLKVLKTSFDQEFPNKTGNSPRTRVLASSPSLQKRENSEDKPSSGPTPLPVKLEAPPQTSSSKGKGVQPVSDHLPAQISTVIPTDPGG